MRRARILVTEFMDERAGAPLRDVHDVLDEPTLVDDAVRLHSEAARADASRLPELAAHAAHRGPVGRIERAGSSLIAQRMLEVLA
ncbi:MAG: hypothetical protein ABIP61_10730 [Burkholderiaceae bacterium]